MAEKKPATKKTVKKDDKVSLEELNKKREEVLARINAEIGDTEEVKKEDNLDKTDDSVDEKVVDNLGKTDEKEDFEKEMLGGEDRDSQETNDTNKDDNYENKDDVKANDETPGEIDEVIEETKDESLDTPDQNDKRSKDDEIASTFSAAEFGLADRRSNKGKNIILFVVVFILVALISALFYFFSTGALKFEPQKENETTVTPTVAPSPTPTPVEFNRADLSVQVLNGSGVSGAAGDMETTLEGLGYENIEVGNAENSDYENVTIQIMEEYEEYAQEISNDLSDDYTVNEDFETLDSDSDFDVIIIVGSESEEDNDATDE